MESWGLIHTCAMKDLVYAMQGEGQPLNIEHIIDMPQAIQALRCGASLALIVQGVTEELEQYLIQRVLILAQGNKSETARRLRMDYKTLYRKLQNYSVSYPPGKHLAPDVGEV